MLGPSHYENLRMARQLDGISTPVGIEREALRLERRMLFCKIQMKDLIG